MAETIEKTISNLVPEQFPGVYREYAPVFVLFVQKYYEWLQDTNNQLYHSRRFFEYKDIDETTEQFLIYFKEKYLKNIQLETVPNTRLLVKHSLDLYRSKGTERSIELLFRLAFGISPKIYYPRSDLFKPSDGVWYKPKYIELSLNENNTSFLYKQIKGSRSDATAFVDAVIRKTIGSILKDVLYISSIRGEFENGERILFSNTSLSNSSVSTIIGSLTSLELDTDGSGSGFEVGDIVDVSSTYGSGATARVSAISENSGVLGVSLVSGGYGYTINANSIISEKMITIDSNTDNILLFERFQQPLANITYINSNGAFVNNDLIFSYYANNSLRGAGRVINATIANSTTGELYIEIYSGNLNTNAIYTSGNTIGANLSLLGGYVDHTAYGNIMHLDVNKVYLFDVVNEFVPNVYWYTTSSAQMGTVEDVSNGGGLDAAISSDLLYSEYILVGNDYILPYANTLLNGTFAFPKLPTANLSTIIDDALNYANVEIGKISALIDVDPGSDYNFVPIVKFLEQDIYLHERRDLILSLSGVTTPFTNGELITQEATGARGLITFVNSSILYAENLRFSQNNQFILTTNSTTIIIGTDSLAEANVTLIANNNNTEIMGYNANIAVSLTTSNGVVTELEVMNSGLNFSNGETVTFQKDELIGYAIAVLGGIGQGNGYYKQKGGFLSDQKKLYDGYYYQDYSYEIISSLGYDKYKDILKNVVHMAGFKSFGQVKHISIAQTNINQITTNIRVE